MGADNLVGGTWARLRLGKSSRFTRRGTTHSRDLSRRDTTRAEDAQGTPTQSHISPSIISYEEQPCRGDVGELAVGEEAVLELRQRELACDPDSVCVCV